MTNPKIAIHNIETNEFIEREMTDQELAELEAEAARAEVERGLAEAEANAKSELLTRLGITEAEAKLLLS